VVHTRKYESNWRLGAAALSPMVSDGFVLAGDTWGIFLAASTGCTTCATEELYVPTTPTTVSSAASSSRTAGATALVAFRPTRLSARSVRRVIQLADTGIRWPKIRAFALVGKEHPVR